MSTVRVRVYYSGRVQGVGFRYTAQQVAHDHHVGGFVRNLPDGRVELVAEGDRNSVDNLLAAIQHHMYGYIHGVQVVDEPPDDPPLEDFTVRH
jgi:acylphosphatase